VILKSKLLLQQQQQQQTLSQFEKIR